MSRKITKILIANRGEIACRVIKTARKMGIVTVAVYSDADRKALHVRMADEAVHIGPSPAIESYLVIEKIIKAAKGTGADAIHPGYGFLSENPDFVRACEKAKITFIGPSAEAMEAMGLKDAAKKLMDAAGVPITPGYHGKDQSPKLLKAKADEIGYPVLIKAVAGGGGKGMRKVEAAKDFDASLASCQREAKASFGNDDVLIEKYITSPRHIEVQVFGDTHGNVVHMFERDCSLQRRHQKVIEEAPAPGMTEAVRKAMTDAAVKAAQAVDYVGAGTVEFIVDGSGELRTDGFWFMEMNTRLQVEHPVTEMITGLDLVEQQIRVAEGGKLPKQKDITMEGHAIEARLYAEDPANDFLPSVGKLDCFDGFHGETRIDTGVEVGDKISVYYDPMIAKMVSYDVTRKMAIMSLIHACEHTSIYPVKTNISFLTACLSHKDFQAGDISTHFIASNGGALVNVVPPDSDLVEIARTLEVINLPRVKQPFGDLTGWRPNLPSKTERIIYINSEERSLPVTTNASTEGPISPWVSLPQGDLITVGNRPYLVSEKGDFGTQANSSNALTAPMPGKIIAVNTKAGEAVKAGDPLIIMEAMKMEMTLEAPRDGVVADVNCEADALVADGDVLLALVEEEDN